MLRSGFHAKDGQRIDSSGAAIAHHADYYGSAGSSTLKYIYTGLYAYVRGVCVILSPLLRAIRRN